MSSVATSVDVITFSPCSPSDAPPFTPSTYPGGSANPSFSTTPKEAVTTYITSYHIHVPEARPPPDEIQSVTGEPLNFLAKMHRKKLVAASKRENLNRTQCQVDNWELNQMKLLLDDFERTKAELAIARTTIAEQQAKIEVYEAAPTHTFLKEKTASLESQLREKEGQIMELKNWSGRIQWSRRRRDWCGVCRWKRGDAALLQVSRMGSMGRGEERQDSGTGASQAGVSGGSRD